MSQIGARGHLKDLHAYISENKPSFCALRDWWNRQEEVAMIIQLIMNEALVRDVSHVNTVTPPPRSELLAFKIEFHQQKGAKCNHTTQIDVGQ